MDNCVIIIPPRLLKVTALASAGAVAGKLIVVAKGATAVGVLGKGAGIGGVTAGPVGAVAGAAVALAAYGVYRALSD